MPTAAEGGVDLEASRGRREHRHDLLRQHRDVPSLHLSSTLVDRIPSGPWKRMWCELDPQALEGLGQLLRVIEGLAVVAQVAGAQISA